MKSEWYRINDLKIFIKHTRFMVFETFGDSNDRAGDDFTELMSKQKLKDKKEMERLLPAKETVQIVTAGIKKRLSKDGEIEFTVTNKAFKKILEELNARMVSNILAKLSSEGLIETAFDSEKNDFVFWVSEKGNSHVEEESPEPETD